MKYYKIRIDYKAGQREWSGEEALKTRYLPNNESNLNSVKFPDFDPLFAKVYITGNLTDVVHRTITGGRGFTISQRLKRILDDFKLYNSRMYSLGFATEYETEVNLNTEYFWLQLLDAPFLDWIDYEKSIFELMDTSSSIPKKIKGLTINDKNELEKAIIKSREVGEFSDKEEEVFYQSLRFNNIFSGLDLDLFYFFGISDSDFTYPIISERLKIRLDKEEVTGFEMKEVNIHVND